MSDEGSRIQRRVFVKGRVQGVGFRAATARVAAQFPQVGGLVRNLADGRVEALFAGPEADVLALVSWCKQGPATAKVTHLEVREEAWDPASGDGGFGWRD